MLQVGRMLVLTVVGLSPSSFVVSARDLRQRRAESADPVLTSGLASVCLSIWPLHSILLRTSRINVPHLRQSHPLKHQRISGCLKFTLQPPYACLSAPGLRPVLSRAKNTAVEFHQEAESPHDKIPRPETTSRYSAWLILIHSFNLSSGFATLLALVKTNILARCAHAG
jgi:hypothetical protein